MFDAVTIIFFGIIMLGIIVFIHEGGHFLAARLMKVRVREFMFGLPGPSIGFKYKKTRYGVTAIPLGGYCLIAGEGGAENPHLADAYTYLAYWGTLTLEDAEKSSETLGFDLVEALDALESWMTIVGTKLKAGDKRYEMPAATIDGVDYLQGTARPVLNLPEAQAHIEEERKATYNGLPWWRRIVILLGGSVFNLIFAIAVITAVIMFIGSATATTMIDTIVEGSPAQEAGLLQGDTLLSVNGQACSTWIEFTQIVSEMKVGDTVALDYSRDGITHTAQITLADNDGVPMVGITPQIERHPISFFEAFGISISLIGLVVQIILQLFNPATFAETVSQSSSIVGISVEARNAALMGPMQFIILAAQLSISIGILNLLPVPPLDGGKIIVETIQRITRRLIPPRIINGISVTALILLMFLFIIITNQDIHRYFLGG